MRSRRWHARQSAPSTAPGPADRATSWPVRAMSRALSRNCAATPSTAVRARAATGPSACSHNRCCSAREGLSILCRSAPRASVAGSRVASTTSPWTRSTKRCAAAVGAASVHSTSSADCKQRCLALPQRGQRLQLVRVRGQVLARDCVQREPAAAGDRRGDVLLAVGVAAGELDDRQRRLAPIERGADRLRDEGVRVGER